MIEIFFLKLKSNLINKVRFFLFLYTKCDFFYLKMRKFYIKKC